jgi:[ribosomal protein S5]-alanine N-acetyltransferase
LGCARENDQLRYRLGGLYDDPFDKGWGIELAYRFAPTAWGKGYATELALSSLAFARDELHLDTVIAFSHPENAASHNVLQKAGFARQKFLPEMNRFLYEIFLA